MPDLRILNGKRILAVDDEFDILEIVAEELSMCHVSIAADFGAAVSLIAGGNWDLVILDIMGVDGFALLQQCTAEGIPACMLTAHAISTDSLNKALRMGAVSFLPKEELGRLPELVAEILDNLSHGRSHWKRLFERMGDYFKTRLGITWEDLEKPGTPPYSY
jgi:DNA-binding response OmpR family regulator